MTQTSVSPATPTRGWSWLDLLGQTLAASTVGLYLGYAQQAGFYGAFSVRPSEVGVGSLTPVLAGTVAVAQLSFLIAVVVVAGLILSWVWVWREKVLWRVLSCLIPILTEAAAFAWLPLPLALIIAAILLTLWVLIWHKVLRGSISSAWSKRKYLRQFASSQWLRTVFIGAEAPHSNQSQGHPGQATAPTLASDPAQSQAQAGQPAAAASTPGLTQSPPQDAGTDDPTTVPDWPGLLT